MTDDGSADRPSSHRASATRGERMRRDIRGLLPPIGAVAAVVGVIIALLAINGGSTPPSRSTVEPPDTRTAVITPPPTTPPPTTTAPVTTAPTGTPATTQATRAVVEKMPVDVLNNSTRSGLAHQLFEVTVRKFVGQRCAHRLQLGHEFR